jgi:hypothetical protein
MGALIEDLVSFEGWGRTNFFLYSIEMRLQESHFLLMVIFVYPQ